MKRVTPDHVLAVRLGHGANCSSIGSVLDLLFATAAIGSAVFAAAAAAVSEKAEPDADADADAAPNEPAKAEPPAKGPP